MTARTVDEILSSALEEVLQRERKYEQIVRELDRTRKVKTGLERLKKQIGGQTPIRREEGPTFPPPRADQTEPLSTKDRFISWLRENPGRQFAATDVSSALGVSPAIAYNLMSEFARDGRIERIMKGRYEAPPEDERLGETPNLTSEPSNNGSEHQPQPISSAV